MRKPSGAKEGERHKRNAKGTHKLDTPAQQGSLEVLILAQLAALEDLHRVHDRDPAVQLPARHVVVQILHQSSRTPQVSIATISQK